MKGERIRGDLDKSSAGASGMVKKNLDYIVLPAAMFRNVDITSKGYRRQNQSGMYLVP